MILGIILIIIGLIAFGLSLFSATEGIEGFLEGFILFFIIVISAMLITCGIVNIFDYYKQKDNKYYKSIEIKSYQIDTVVTYRQDKRDTIYILKYLQ